jgi:hypothetical protein
MTFNRRNFLQKAGMFSASTLFSSLLQPAWSRNIDKALDKAASLSPDNLAADEDFWYYIQQSFTVSPSLINLNNGGVSPAPKTVQDAMKRFYDYSNEAPSYYMWRIWTRAANRSYQPRGFSRLQQRRDRHQSQCF